MRNVERHLRPLHTYAQSQTWGEQVQHYPGFLFAVKASRYITHMRKLQHAEEGVQRLDSAAKGLGEHLGPFLYQLPPLWRANVPRLEQFIASLPRDRRAAFEFRDPSWFQPEQVQALRCILGEAGCALVISIGGTLSTPLARPW